ncbi:MAG: response regulator [Mucilaginibacter sp.]|nr:response regulator [Mucilaginibacter sp.]
MLHNFYKRISYERNTMNDPIRILLVEDEEINNYIAARLIKKALPAAEVIYCQHGKEAIELLSGMKRRSLTLPDYILLDISMPIMNGWQFLDEYSKEKIDPEGKCTVFMLSSSVFSDDINRARTYTEVKGFISKPLNIAKIRELFSTEETV